ncbi:MAG TPA: hypothetical protein PKM64_03035, partial [Thermoanaerobaculia bacterium]|nr:hypothetical protein [Thermoanaerobaculia bacterium]
DAVERGPGDLPGPVPDAVAVATAKKGTPHAADDLLTPDGEAEAGTAEDGAGWRLVVIGDSDFATNGHLASVGNPTLLANAMNWLVERPQLLGIGPKRPEQVRLSLTTGQLRAVTLWVLLGLPGLAVAAGVWMHFRRRR